MRADPHPLDNVEGETGATCATLAPTTGRGNVQFAAETAAITGESKSQINRHLARADAMRADPHPLDNVEGEIAVEQVVPPQNASPMARPQVKEFAAETAAITGETKQSINRHLARWTMSRAKFRWENFSHLKSATKNRPRKLKNSPPRLRRLPAAKYGPTL